MTVTVTPPPSEPAPVLLARLLAVLHHRGIARALVRPPGRDGRGRLEADLLVAPADRAATELTLAELGFRRRPGWGRRPHRFHVRPVVGPDHHQLDWLKVDLVTDLCFGRWHELATGSAAGCLAAGARPEQPRLQPADELAALLLHGLLDGRGLRSTHRRRLAALAPRSHTPGPLGRLLDRRAPDRSGWAALVAAVEAERWAELEGLGPELAARLGRRRPLTAPARRMGRRVVRRCTKPLTALAGRGPLVALVGPDGTGKTTLAAAVARSAGLPARVFYGGTYRRGGPGTLGVGRRLLTTRVRIGWHRARGRLVVLDRHPAQARPLPGDHLGLRAGLRRRALAVTLPRPDLFVALDAPAAVLHARRPEHTVDHLDRDRRRTLRLVAAHVPSGVLDATDEPHQVTNRAVELVWERAVPARPRVRHRRRRPGAPLPDPEPAVDRARAAVDGDRPARSATEVPPTVVDRIDRVDPTDDGPGLGASPAGGGDDGAGDDGTARTDGATGEVGRNLRGSSLLLVGRLLSLFTNLVIQVLLVRALSKADFGIFAYALSVVAMLTTLVTFGLDRGLARFVAVYEERGDRARLRGTVALQLATIGGLGLAAVSLTVGLRGWIGRDVVDDPRLATLLAVMVLLAPLQAVDAMVGSLFAAFAESRVIFVRRYVLAPLLRLAIIAVLLLVDGDVYLLAAGQVVAGGVGLAVYGTVLRRTLRRRGLLERPAHGPATRVPFREIGAFTLPLLVSDLMFVVLNTSDVVILGRTAGTAAVASYRAVLPVARLNQLVMNSFALLFGPLMARLWARGDRQGLGEAYWQTAVWVAVLSFPLFAATVGLARPLTVVLFGARYADAVPYLQILATAYFFNASLGFNGLTLKMAGRVGLVAGTAAAALVFDLAANLLLIPRHGALGAAWGTASAVVFYNLVKQWALRRGTGVPLIDPRHLATYLSLLAGSVLVVVVGTTDVPDAVRVAGVAVATAGVLRVGRRSLLVAERFPELGRVPLLGRYLTSAAGGVA